MKPARPTFHSKHRHYKKPTQPRADPTRLMAVFAASAYEPTVQAREKFFLKESKLANPKEWSL